MQGDLFVAELSTSPCSAYMSQNRLLFDISTKFLMGFVARVLGEACKKSFGTLFVDNKTICLHGKQSSLKAGSNIRPIQSLQLQHDSPSKCHMK